MATSLIPLIPEDFIPQFPSPAIFEDLAAKLLGNAATEDDGFDAKFSEIMRDIGDDDRRIEEPALDLDSAADALATIAADDYSEKIEELADALKEGEAILLDFGIDVDILKEPEEGDEDDGPPTWTFGGEWPPPDDFLIE